MAVAARMTINTGYLPLCLTDSNMIKIYQLRPEIEEDHRQWKHGLWDIEKFTSTSLVQVIYNVICVLL